MWNQLEITMANLDDPIGDPLTVPNYLLAQMAQHDVKIILNGEGGDPCFGGPKNQPMLLNKLYAEQDLLSAYLTSFQKCFLDLPRLLKPEVLKAIKHQNHVFKADLYGDAFYLNRLMLLNIKFKGADHILTKVNNLTEAAQLQGLSPLFDRRIVELAMSIPPQYKVAGAAEKAVLKQAVADLLPPEIIKSPKSCMIK
jgi:asparagine synthase (glutamine-hydrolysing)